MGGSWSLKRIAPTLPKVAGVVEYDELQDVAGGMEAKAAYMEMRDPTLIGLDREEMKERMLRYCGTDTGGMYRFTLTVQRALAQRLPAPVKKAKAKRVKAGSECEAMAA